MINLVFYNIIFTISHSKSRIFSLFLRILKIKKIKKIVDWSFFFTLKIFYDYKRSPYSAEIRQKTSKCGPNYAQIWNFLKIGYFFDFWPFLTCHTITCSKPFLIWEHVYRRIFSRGIRIFGYFYDSTTPLWCNGSIYITTI